MATTNLKQKMNNSITEDRECDDINDENFMNHTHPINIPQFLPVMRGTVSLPANRDPEVLERLHPDHFKNMCNRMEIHLNASAAQVGNDQAHITTKMKEVDFEAAKVFNSFTEKQKLYSTYAEQFAKLHHVTQQLSRCNVLLNQNIESMEILNNMLDINDRLEPFIWKTSGD